VKLAARRDDRLDLASNVTRFVELAKRRRVDVERVDVDQKLAFGAANRFRIKNFRHLRKRAARENDSVRTDALV
jgi:hypothetical protein